MPSHSSRRWIALNMYEEDLLWVWSGSGTSIKRTNRDPPPTSYTNNIHSQQVSESREQISGCDGILMTCSYCNRCWISLYVAFLRYIRKQVEQFSQDVSSKMIENMFHRYIPTLSMTTNRDPRQNNAEMQRNVGGNATCQARLPFVSSSTTKGADTPFS